LEPVTLSKALNRAMRDAMREDPSVVVLGEEITNWGSGGGLFGATQGLVEDFGQGRVRDVPISEEAVVAAAVGAALLGQRVIVDINYSDFLLLAMSPIVNAAAKYRYIFNGQYDVPLVLRANTGANHGKGSQHSQSLETVFAHIPGLEVVMPSTPSDAYWLLRSAIRSPNPTVFLEHKALYGLKGPIGSIPVAMGAASVVRPGRHVTVIASQLMLHRALSVADRLSSKGAELEVIDIRCLFPLDIEAVVDSARRTGRVVICHESPQMYGFGAELAACITENCWSSLRGPVLRVGGARSPIPFAPVLEDEVVPAEGKLEEAVTGILCR
jgi:acetoin:2,6-dichlorophenolindophenol oxidoreductase subunit beta